MKTIFAAIAMAAAAPCIAQTAEPAQPAPAAEAPAPADDAAAAPMPGGPPGGAPGAPAAGTASRATPDPNAILTGPAAINAYAPRVSSACGSSTMGQTVTTADGKTERCGPNAFAPGRVDARVDARVRPAQPH